MSDLNSLLEQIQTALNSANELSQDVDDNFALCAQSLTTARSILVGDQDRSADCHCLCHTNPGWHALPCGCYTGNPVE